MKDSTLIILGLLVSALCGSYLTYYGLLRWKHRFNYHFHNHHLFKSTLAVAAALWGFIALLVAGSGAVNGGLAAIEVALTLNGLLK